MSEITQEEMVKFMRGELETREQSYPVRVEMGRMKPAEAKKNLAMMRAILATLMRSSVAHGPVVTAATHLEEIRELDERLRNVVQDDKLVRIMPTLNQVHICAREHAKECIHCDSIAKVLDDVFQFTASK